MHPQAQIAANERLAAQVAESMSSCETRRLKNIHKTNSNQPQAHTHKTQRQQQKQQQPCTSRTDIEKARAELLASCDGPSGDACRNASQMEDKKREEKGTEEEELAQLHRDLMQRVGLQ